jgi:GWxTD domain-containing protein
MKGKMWLLLSLVGVLLPGVSQRGMAQTDVQQDRDVEATPIFFFDAIVYATEHPGKSRIDFYVQVPYNELRFIKEGETYTARYDVTLNVLDGNQSVLEDRSWSVDVRLPDIRQTTSSKLYSLTQREVEIKPGQYRIAVQMKDQDSKKAGKLQRSLLVTDFEKDSLSLSDVMMVSRLSVSTGGKRTIVPNIRGSVGTEDEAFFLFFEVYHHVPMDSVELTWKIFDEKNIELRHAATIEPVTGNKTQAFLKTDSLDLPVGTYLIAVDARSWPDTTRISATTSRSFTVRWANIPFSITDIDKAVDQLRYVAEPSDLDYIRAATTPEEKRKRFTEFWAKRDPDPSTARNELMEEYYRRVEYSNKHFSHYLEGWKTDMGMVYIRFGAPENVERHPFDMNSKPYEVWYYYQLERQFVFVDETGFGDYRLRYPTTDLWGRVR